MWLGDIARLPIDEQYYLLSENVESDHTIGSEFYDGQIECIFSKLSPENELIKCRADFFEFLFQKYSEKFSSLDNETFKMIEDLNPPILFTEKELRDKYDTLNKILIESLDNNILNKLLKSRGLNFKNLGSLKKLQSFLEKEYPNADIKGIISPLFVLYDLRVAYSHISSDEGKREVLEFVCDRLKIEGKENDSKKIYNTLVNELIKCYKDFIKLV